MCCMILAFVSMPSRAALNAIDLPGGNIDEVTRDTNTGLDWLDLTELMNDSYDTAVASANTAYGPGWRHATGDEVDLLLSTYGLDPQTSGHPFSGGVTDLGAPHTENDLLLSMLGITLPQGTYDLSQASYDDQYGTAGLVGRAKIGRSLDFGGINTAYTESFMYDEASFSNVVSYASGHFLVRQVPEPSTSLLLITGLVLLKRQRPAYRMLAGKEPTL